MWLLVDIIFIAVVLIVMICALANRDEKKLKQETQQEQYDSLWNSISEQVTQTIPVSQKFSSNPFINNPITIEVVENFLRLLCDQISRGPTEDDKNYFWRVTNSIRCTETHIGSISFQERNLVPLELGQRDIFIKAVGIHLESALKILKDAADQIYSYSEIQMYFYFEWINEELFLEYFAQQCRENPKVEVIIDIENPNYIEPETREQWF